MDKELGIKIRYTTKKDLKDYLELRKLVNKEHEKITSQKINITEKQIKKEFSHFVTSSKQMILFAEENKEVVGCLAISIYKGLYKKVGFIDDIFVLKDYRKKEIATKLINEFMGILKKKKINYIRLGVNPKNKVAQNLYKKLGFKITHYEMEKRLK